MVLVDASVWVDHLRGGVANLGALLDRVAVLIHPAVLGEIAMGNLRQRDVVLRTLAGMPRAVVGADDEVLGCVTRHELFGLGIGWIDAHLLVSALLSPDTTLWTRDRRLRRAAERLGVATPLD